MNTSNVVRTPRASRLGAAVCVAIGMTMGTAALAQQAPSGPLRLATQADLQAMFDAKQYKLCLQQIYRTLMATPKDALVARGNLLVLRAEALVQLDDMVTARETAFQVEKMLSAGTMGDDARPVFAGARTLRLLIAASRGGVMSVGNGEDVKLADLPSRSKAYAALLSKEMAEARQAVDKALAASDLATAKNALPMLTDARSVEIVATGKDAMSGELGMRLGEHVRGLLGRELDAIENSVNSIQASANTTAGTVDVGGAWWAGVPIQRGLWSTDRDKLRDMLETLGKIDEVCGMAATYAQNAGANPGSWEAVRNRTGTIAAKARDLLESQ